MLRSDPDFDYHIFMGSAEFIGFEPSGRANVKPGEKTDLDLLLDDFANLAELSPPSVNLLDVAVEHFGDKSHKRSEQVVRGTTRGLKTSFAIRLSETEDRLDPPFYFFRYQASELLSALEPLSDTICESGAPFRLATDEERDDDYQLLSVTTEGLGLGVLISGWDFRDNYPYQRVARGDVIYNPSRVNIGSMGVVTDDLSGALVSPEYIVFRSNDLNPDFLVDLLRSPFYRMYINVITTGSIRNRLYFRDLQKIRTPRLPINFQRELSDRNRRAAYIMDVRKGSGVQRSGRYSRYVTLVDLCGSGGTDGTHHRGGVRSIGVCLARGNISCVIRHNHLNASCLPTNHWIGRRCGPPDPSRDRNERS